MKRFTAITLAALMVLTVFASVIPVSAVTVDSVEVRGPVYDGANLTTILAANSGSLEMNSTNFAGFYYDIDDDIGTEVLIINNQISGENVILEDGLIYTTTIMEVNYDSDAFSTKYPVLGLFAEKYVPIKDDDAGKLAKLLIDDDDKYTMRTGQSIDLAGGFSLTAQQVDVEGDKVWMELTKDGEFVEDEIIDVSNGEANWTYDRDDVQGEDDVVVFKVQITNVFQGQIDSLAVVEGMWLIDYTDILEIETGDDFDELEVESVGMSIVLKNTGTITLTQDSTRNIAEGMEFKVADSGTLRYYPFVEYTIGDTTDVDTTPVDDTTVNDTDDTTAPVNDTDDTTTPVNDTDDTTTPVDDTPVVNTTTNDTEEEDPGIPGFASIFAITGLLAVAYLVRRN